MRNLIKNLVKGGALLLACSLGLEANAQSAGPIIEFNGGEYTQTCKDNSYTKKTSLAGTMRAIKNELVITLAHEVIRFKIVSATSVEGGFTMIYKTDEGSFIVVTPDYFEIVQNLVFPGGCKGRMVTRLKILSFY